jgi:aspartate carbamoyltransferase catalytic subunit
MVQTL